MAQVSSMIGSWDKLIRCAIDNEDTTVFHKITDIVWTAEEAADKALFASEDFLQSLRHEDRKIGGGEGDTRNDVLETDVGVGTGEYVDEDTGEGVLTGDVCMGNVDADFDGDASQKLVMGIFKEESHDKIREIGALVAGYKGGCCSRGVLFFEKYDVGGAAWPPALRLLPHHISQKKTPLAENYSRKLHNKKSAARTTIVQKSQKITRLGLIEKVLCREVACRFSVCDCSSSCRFYVPAFLESDRKSAARTTIAQKIVPVIFLAKNYMTLLRLYCI